VQPEEDKPESMRPARPGVKRVEKEIAIVNCFGLHLRHAARFAQTANRFCGEVWVAKDGTEVNGKSILGLITLGAIQGSRLRIRIEGADAAEAMRSYGHVMEEHSVCYFAFKNGVRGFYDASCHFPGISLFRLNGAGGYVEVFPEGAITLANARGFTQIATDSDCVQSKRRAAATRSRTF
jgi:phosphocarrier protein